MDVIGGVRLFWNWRWTIVGTVLASLGLTFLVVKLIPPLYESHATLLPSNTNSRAKQLEEFNFGYEVHSERLVQLLESSVILDSLDQGHQLAKHYGVDLKSPEGWDDYIKIATDRIQFHKTQYSSVIISVMDEDSKMAALIANEVARLVNVINAEILKSNGKIALEAAEKEYSGRVETSLAINDSIRSLNLRNQDVKESLLQAKIKEKERTLTALRKELDDIRNNYQIFDYGKQVDILNEQLAEARAVLLQQTGTLEVLQSGQSQVADSMVVMAEARKNGAEKRVNFFHKQLKDLSKVNARYNAALDKLAQERGLLAEARTDLDQLNKSLEPSFSTRNLQELEQDYAWDMGQSRELKRSYQRALSNFLDPVPIAYVVEPARPSYKKVFPKTILSLALGGIGALVLCLTTIAFIERLRSTKMT